MHAITSSTDSIEVVATKLACILLGYIQLETYICVTCEKDRSVGCTTCVYY